MIITNKHNLPQAIVDLVNADNKTHESHSYGATTILKSTREIILNRRHENEIELDVADCVNRLFGTAFHSLIEKHDKTGMSELSLKENIVADYNLIGKLDLYDTEKEAVIDYKTATCWKVIFKDFEDWRKQGLIYAWLCMRNGLVVKKIIFYAFLKDWTARDKRKQGDSYPDSQIYTYELDVSISDIMQIEDYIINKFRELKEANELSDDDLPACSKEDCWYTGDKYAVYKNESDKKAQRVFDNEQEANDYAKYKGGTVVYREGEYRKCQDYCEVCKFCNKRGGK